MKQGLTFAVLLDSLVMLANSEPFQIKFQYNDSPDTCQGRLFKRITIQPLNLKRQILDRTAGG